jgi:hypothetical protein
MAGGWGAFALDMLAIVQHTITPCLLNQSAMLRAGFIKTNLMKSNSAVGLRDDSPYNQFSHVSH